MTKFSDDKAISGYEDLVQPTLQDVERPSNKMANETQGQQV